MKTNFFIIFLIISNNTLFAQDLEIIKASYWEKSSKIFETYFLNIKNDELLGIW